MFLPQKISSAIASLTFFVRGKHTLFIILLIQGFNCSITLTLDNSGAVRILLWLLRKFNKWFLESQTDETMRPLTSCNAFHILKYYIIIVALRDTAVTILFTLVDLLRVNIDTDKGWKKYTTSSFRICTFRRILLVTESRRMRWAGHVTCMGYMRNAYKISVGESEEERPLRIVTNWVWVCGLISSVYGQDQRAGSCVEYVQLQTS